MIDQWLDEIATWEKNGMMMQLLQFLIWALVIFLITWLIRKAINRSVSDNTMRYRARKVTRLVGYVLVLLLAVVSFTGKVQYFTITIGLISAGLAFALQEVILSIAGWVAIYSNTIYKPGDRIELNGVKGDVIDIGLTRTTLMEIGEWVKSDNYSGRIVQVSNSFVFKGVVHNYSTDFPFVWDEIELPIHYGSDIELAHKLFMDAANESLLDYAEFASEHWKQMVKKYLIENAHVEPTLSMNLTDNWISFNLRYVVDYKSRRKTKTDLYKRILAAIEQADGKVELASATFEIVGTSKVKVDLKKLDL